MKKWLLTAMLFYASTVFAHDIPRYFGQTAQSHQNTLPFGNNAEAGHYANADDAKIYYEVYGKASRS